MIFFKDNQEEAVSAVRQDMKALCDIVVQSLEKYGIECQKFHPHELSIIGS